MLTASTLDSAYPHSPLMLKCPQSELEAHFIILGNSHTREAPDLACLQDGVHGIHSTLLTCQLTLDESTNTAHFGSLRNMTPVLSL